MRFDRINRRFSSAEALLRLTDSELGRIAPSEFIPLAEKAGLIIEMGYLVLEKVCSYIKQLEASGTYIQFISVNFSALQIQDVHLVDRVKAITLKYEVVY